MTDEEIDNRMDLYEEMNEKIAGILMLGDEPEQYAAKYIKSLRADNERLKVENAILKKNANEAYQQGLNEMKELVVPEIRKETAKEILRELVENKFNIGKALYRQSIDEDCDVVSVDTLKLVIAEKYGVEVDEA